MRNKTRSVPDVERNIGIRKELPIWFLYAVFFASTLVSIASIAVVSIMVIRAFG